MQYLTADGELVESHGVFLRTEYNYDRNAASDYHGSFNDEPSKTQQQFKEESDINTLVRRFGLTGTMPDDFRMPISGDFTDAVTDYHTAQQILVETREEFMRIPAELRERFQNDPQVLMDYLADPKNNAESIELGLRNAPPKPEEPVAVRVVADAAPPGTVTT